MQSGIYDARGKLIETTVERIEEPQVPESSKLAEETEGGSILKGTVGEVFNTSNFGGNIIIRGTTGRPVIELKKDGAIIIYDDTQPRALFGKQIGGF